jgi:hypothetical protein
VDKQRAALQRPITTKQPKPCGQSRIFSGYSQTDLAAFPRDSTGHRDRPMCTQWSAVSETGQAKSQDRIVAHTVHNKSPRSGNHLCLEPIPVVRILHSSKSQHMCVIATFDGVLRWFFQVACITSWPSTNPARNRSGCPRMVARTDSQLS